MGTEIVVVYGGAAGRAGEVGAKLADLFERNYSGCLLRNFAKVRKSSESNVYEFYQEVSDLEGRADLERRLLEQGAGMFTYELNLEFAPSEAYVMLFESGPEFETTAVISFEKQLTSYLFTAEVTEAPFVAFLERIGRTIQASCYVAGADYVRWLPLKPEDLTDPEVFEDSPQVIGWRDGTVDSALVLKALRAKREWLEKSLHGYSYVSLLSRHKQRDKSQGSGF